MVSFVVITILGVLWVHYASQWVNYGPPTWMSTMIAVGVAHFLTTLLFIQVLISPAVLPLPYLPYGVLFAGLGFPILALSLVLFLRTKASRNRPSIPGALGLAATTIGVAALPGLAGFLFSNVEAG